MKNIFKNTLLVTSLIVFVFSLMTVSFVFAQTGDVGGTSPKPDIGGTSPKPDIGGTSAPGSMKLDNPIKANNIQDLLFTIVDLAIFIGVIVAVLMFLFVGFKFVMARGNEGEISDAKQWFLYAVIGTAILISSKVIVVVIKNTLVSSGVVDEKAFILPR